MRKVPLVSQEYYHVFSRTVRNTPVFKDEDNLRRLYRAFWIANSTNSDIVFQLLRSKKNLARQEILEILGDGKKLVDILCYAVMPDHYHLLLKELEEGGISEFVRKNNISVAKYINIKTDQRGPIFERPFGSRHVDTNKYLLQLSLYIHLNPLDFLLNRGWRTHGLRDWTIAKQKLFDYPWSSLKSFLDKKTEDIVLSGNNIILDQFTGGDKYDEFLREWAVSDFDALKDYL